MNRLRMSVLMASLTLVPAAAMAQGAALHGFGPINSSMGGAGVALPEDSLNALGFNPAMISAVEGNQITFATEFFQDAIQITTTLGTQTGYAEGTSHLNIVPAFGWMMRAPGKKLALGFGLIGVAGFGADYKQDTDSILFAQPPNGFGRIWTGYQVTKIPVAFAYQVTPKLALGFSFNTYVGQFSVAPLPDGTFDVAANGDVWYPEAGKPSQKFAFAGQFGFRYQHNDKMSIGASFTTPQNYSPYEYNSSIADPTSSSYGLHRTIEYDLDGPWSATFGTGLVLGAKTSIAIDGMFTKHEGINGFHRPLWLARRVDVQDRRYAPGHRKATGARGLQLQPDAPAWRGGDLGHRCARNVPAPLYRRLRHEDLPVPDRRDVGLLRAAATRHRSADQSQGRRAWHDRRVEQADKLSHRPELHVLVGRGKPRPL
jgi:long-subunit fatty acid transport protein